MMYYSATNQQTNKYINLDNADWYINKKSRYEVLSRSSHQIELKLSTSVQNGSQRNIPMVMISNNLFFMTPQILPVSISEDGYFCVDIKPINMHTCEESMESVIKLLKLRLEDYWQMYAKASDDELTHRAQNVKKWMLKNISEK